QASFTEEDLELANSVRGIIGRRLERLSEPAQRMLVAAAVIGLDFDIPLLEAFGELSGHELRDAIDEATRSHFLTAAGADRFRFSHDLVRQRVLAVLPLPRLQAYHLAVAGTLERGYGKSATEKAAEIAHHLYQAGTSADPLKTSDYLAQAAANAMAVGAFEEVLRLIELTLQLLPGDKIRERAAALAARGHGPVFGWVPEDRRQLACERQRVSHHATHLVRPEARGFRDGYGRGRRVKEPDERGVGGGADEIAACVRRRVAVARFVDDHPV